MKAMPVYVWITVLVSPGYLIIQEWHERSAEYLHTWTGRATATDKSVPNLGSSTDIYNSYWGTNKYKISIQLAR